MNETKELHETQTNTTQNLTAHGNNETQTYTAQQDEVETNIKGINLTCPGPILTED